MRRLVLPPHPAQLWAPKRLGAEPSADERQSKLAGRPGRFRRILGSEKLAGSGMDGSEGQTRWAIVVVSFDLGAEPIGRGVFLRAIGARVRTGSVLLPTQSPIWLLKSWQGPANAPQSC